MRYLLALLLASLASVAQAASLTLDTGHGATTLTTAQLLARKGARAIDVPGDVSYHRAMRYKAVPLRALLQGVPADAHLQFTALDGFAAEIPASLVLDGHGAEAWLAVEDAPWPSLGDGKPSAGPFYLVWLHPAAGKVGPEQWPYQIATIRVLADPAARFPLMRPAPGLAKDSPVMRGFEVFQRNCLTCHTLNGQGDAKLGPDLNIPHSPTEYLREGMLRVLVRNPQDLRHWPQAKMPAFGPQVLTDKDLDDLEAYLKHMAGRKPH
ncbi:c-type cytochrome [Luteibacter yeojuensis]|uniref:Cytochrome C n=1 Tax=Luteibacter yeojuensis TaxID=345309 RepID=A0A0F3KGL0_9GAMM|nr:cytochrome c [Luteibacter yeojuensis]KJV30395.1 cytochrome C [Luteibacter yeojuensis]